VPEQNLQADPDRRSAQANSFGAAASTYERARPSYPAAAVDWLLPDGDPRVLDLGAGTGKLTRLIADRGIDVTAVDPSEGMLEQLRQALPQIPALVGTAEQIPLADDAVDAVLVGQAWHWVDVPRASVEVTRVLRPGGRLGLVWNHRDERVDWVRQLTEIASQGRDHADAQIERPDFGPAFTQIEYFETEWRAPMTPAALLALIASRSYYIVSSEQERETMQMRIQDLLDHHPQLAGRSEFEMPYVTYASRAHAA